MREKTIRLAEAMVVWPRVMTVEMRDGWNGQISSWMFSV